MNLLAVARGVGGDLGRFLPVEPAPFEVLANLLAAWAGSVEVFLRVALDLRRAASPRLDLISQLESRYVSWDW